MGIISEGAEYRKNSLQSEIADLDSRIKKASEEYDSLLRFRDSVSRAQNNFNAVNDHRRLMLADLNNIKKNNTVVQKYQSGMGDQLTGVGMKVVDAAFVGLQIMIGLKLTEYFNSIAFMNVEKGKKELEYQAIDIIV